MTNFAQDMRVKTGWGKSLTEWDRASEKDRAWWRENVTDAPYFEETA